MDKCTCEKNKEECNCVENTGKVSKDFFDAWCKSLEELEQPTCNIENQEDCENCGS